MASNEENLPLGRNHRMRLVRLRVSETEIDVLTEEEDDLKRPPFCMGFIHPLSKVASPKLLLDNRMVAGVGVARTVICGLG